MGMPGFPGINGVPGVQGPQGSMGLPGLDGCNGTDVSYRNLRIPFLALCSSCIITLKLDLICALFLLKDGLVYY